jgi:Metallo-peptidase family M12B Reprolysin-like
LQGAIRLFGAAASSGNLHINDGDQGGQIRMSDFRCGPARTLAFLLLLASACLASGGADAVPITDYITVQPIDICSGAPGTTTGCAPINSLGQNYKTAAVGAIGAIASGINVTRAIWNQIGLDVTFLPAVQDANAGAYLTLSVDANSNPLTSTQFQTLSDQSGISQGLPPTPSPPLSQNPSTINLFFVNKLMPITPPGGTLYGFSWVNNNGAAIAANSLGPVTGRPDTVAHELGHNLGLNHMDIYNPGSPPSNLMTAGDTRTLSSLATVLNNLNTGVADQLNPLQAGYVLDPTGFLNPIPGVSATVVAPGSGPGPFQVSFDQPGRPGEFLSKLTLTAPNGVLFQPSTFQVTGSSSGLQGKVTCEAPCSGGSIVLDFAKGAFVDGQSFDYRIGVCQQQANGCNESFPDQLLLGGTYTYQFETDDSTGNPIEQFQTTGDLVDVGSGIADLSSNSQLPDLSFPSEILDPASFVGYSDTPCTLVDGSCPALVLEDADPAEDNPPAPEPSSLLILASSLLAVPAVYRRSRPAPGGHSKPA